MPALTGFGLAAALVLEAGTGGWSVGVTTSGGLAGVGRGSVVVDDGGTATALRPAPRGRPGLSCLGKPSGAELSRIAAAVLGSKPAGWASAKPKPATPDAFGYVLELRRGEETHRAAWHDGTRGGLPPDLAELYAAVEAAWQGAMKGCDES